MFKRTLHLACICMLCMLMIGCSKQETHIVAKIDNGPDITFDELMYNFYHQYPYYKSFPFKYEVLKEYLNLMISDQYKILEANASNICKDSTIIKNIEAKINYELYTRFTDNKVVNNLISEDKLLDYFRSIHREFYYRQIIIYRPDSTKTRQLQEKQEKAWNIMEQLNSGKAFEQIASAYSEDPKSASMGGLMPPIRSVENNNPVIRILMRMEAGQVSSIIKTKTAFYIVKLDKIVQLKIDPSDQERKEILEQYQQVNHQKIKDKFDRIVDALYNGKSFEWNDSGLNQLKSWAEQADMDQGNYMRIINSHVEKGMNFNILNYAQGQVNLGDFNYMLHNTGFASGLDNPSIEAHQEMIISFVKVRHILLESRRLGLDEDVLESDRLKFFYHHELAKAYDRHIIHPQMPEADEANLRIFYDEHKNTQFYQDEMILINLVINDDMEKLKEMIDKIQNGTPFSAVCNRSKILTYSRDNSGKVDQFRADKNMIIGEKAVSMQKGDVLGPFKGEALNVDGKYAILYCRNREPGKTMSYSEAQHTIRKKFNDFYLNKIEQENISQLKEKYKTQIFMSALKLNASGIKNIQAITN